MALAARQYGVVTRTQLRRAGLSEAAVDRRLSANRLRRLYRGVYLVGPLLVPRAQALAAVLACGDGAALSHRSAAKLWELLPREVGDAFPEVTIPGGDRRQPGIRIHRHLVLRPDEVTTFAHISVTTPARTLLDLAGSAPERELERALAEAFARRRVNRAVMLALLSRCGRRPGANRLRAMLAAGGLALTRSDAEERFLALIRKAQLPMPETNATVAGYEVDFFWRTERLVTEVDGMAFHSSPARFEGDRRRDALLAARGLRVIRVTWRQLLNEPEALLVRLTQALAWAPTLPAAGARVTGLAPTRGRGCPSHGSAVGPCD